jgi:molybdopterin adenylyltransferase
MEISIGILTVSDRAHQGVYADKSGPEIEAFLSKALATPWKPIWRLVPDDRNLIEQALCELADTEDCSLVITTGGTGPSPRDVTPDATAAVCEKMLPGFGEIMRGISVGSVPTAILSRQTAGIRKRSLIINLPGRPQAIRDCLAAVFPAVPYGVELIGGPHIECHPTVVAAYRPKS